MEQPKTYENYPGCIIFASNFVSIATYLIGAFIMAQIGLIWLVLYLLYIAGLEIRLMKWHCTSCYYYGKYCAFGKGKISSWFFKKGDPNNFLRNKITFKDILPDFLVSIIPLIAGLVLLISNFNWLILALIILLVILASAGSGFVRKNLACKFCKQREIGCPAEQLFNKK
ncbi:MAG: hypothetical protein WC619_03010 [Patescibacteria group bacterium]